MSNFAFLIPEWPELQPDAQQAEARALTDPRGACFYARRALEGVVRWLYEHDPTLSPPYDDTLSALLHAPAFRDLLPQEVWVKTRALKDLGNEAVHGRREVEPRAAQQAVRELFHLYYWLARTYARQDAARYRALQFDASLLSARAKQAAERRKSTAADLQLLQLRLEEQDRVAREREEQLLLSGVVKARQEAAIAALKAEIAAAKQANAAVPDTHHYSEAETRSLLIDLLLREAGWALDQPRDREYPVVGMPNRKGEGFVDYVLWGDDGLPLGIVEAKRTSKDPQVGRTQAKLYADCLEQMTGQRPVIFYTNGYQTWIWDDDRYPPRPIQGFYKKDELELLIRRRASRKPLAAAAVDGKIVERPYLVQSVRRVTETFEKNQRKALVVMATGGGKTRAVIALCDVLQRCNWIKRVLFLADRVALVNQAANAFKAHLPGCSPVNLVTEKETDAGRVFLSTYPTMMGLIDQLKGDERPFGVGHFDLVVIDEAHRSVYQRYAAIFAYFDSLLVGLTATPKDEVDKNTYRLFDLENGDPTFSYDLEEAVADGWLVPPRAVSVPLKFPREGISYDDLSEDEREEWDAIDWDEEGTVPNRVEAAALNNWLFNEDTVDKVLETLMERGLKVEDGDRLGKTILFAKNHKHALYLQERFDQHYPQHRGTFARVIDHFEPYAQALLDDFYQKDRPPHLAISVDMLDTGVDVPEVVNLVFFKLVRSKTKFWQMIGRGTRRCPNLFGPGKDKEHFLVFDYLQNFEFFNAKPQGVEGQLQEPLGKRLFLARLELLQSVRGAGDPPPELADLAHGVADELHREVAAMNPENFIVRPHRKQVETYREREAWDVLPSVAVTEIEEHLAGLPNELDSEEMTARQFDLLLLNLQLAYLNHEPAFPRLQKQVMQIAGLLEEKDAIPMVHQQMELILELQTEAFWQDVTLPELERVRKRLRDLVKFIERANRKIVYTDFEDSIGPVAEGTPGPLAFAVDVAEYRRKVLRFLNEHLEHPAILKLRLNEPLAPADLDSLQDLLYNLDGQGSRERFEQIFGPQASLPAFIRGLVGLDRRAAEQAFARFLEGSRYTADQIQFIRHLIDRLTRSGVMDLGALYEQPFTDAHPEGLDGVFPNDALQIVAIIRQINANAAGESITVLPPPAPN